ncbi:hypothetical protein T439DRAFT_320346 [Meredithblackwellia eburnea MCA 4105]
MANSSDEDISLASQFALAVPERKAAAKARQMFSTLPAEGPKRNATLFADESDEEYDEEEEEEEDDPMVIQPEDVVNYDNKRDKNRRVRPPKEKKQDNLSGPYRAMPLDEPYRTEISIGDLQNFLEEKPAGIDLYPPYQRDAVWREDRMAGLIHSIWNRYYIPPLVFNKIIREGQATPTLICVDGKQRLTSIMSFLQGLVPLKDDNNVRWIYTENDTAKKTWQVVDEEFKTTFLNVKMHAVIYDDMEASQELQLFSKIQLGMALTAEEQLSACQTPWTRYYEDLMKAFWFTPIGTKNKPPGSAEGEGILELILPGLNSRNKAYMSMAQILFNVKSSPKDAKIFTSIKMRNELEILTDDVIKRNIRHMKQSLTTLCNLVRLNSDELGYHPLFHHVSPVEFEWIVFIIQKGNQLSADYEQLLEVIKFFREHMEKAHRREKKKNSSVYDSARKWLMNYDWNSCKGLFDVDGKPTDKNAPPLVVKKTVAASQKRIAPASTSGQAGPATKKSRVAVNSAQPSETLPTASAPPSEASSRRPSSTFRPLDISPGGVASQTAPNDEASTSASIGTALAPTIKTLDSTETSSTPPGLSSLSPKHTHDAPTAPVSNGVSHTNGSTSISLPSAPIVAEQKDRKPTQTDLARAGQMPRPKPPSRLPSTSTSSSRSAPAASKSEIAVRDAAVRRDSVGKEPPSRTQLSAAAIAEQKRAQDWKNLRYNTSANHEPGAHSDNQRSSSWQSSANSEPVRDPRPRPGGGRSPLYDERRPSNSSSYQSNGSSYSSYSQPRQNSYHQAQTVKYGTTGGQSSGSGWKPQPYWSNNGYSRR